MLRFLAKFATFAHNRDIMESIPYPKTPTPSFLDWLCTLLYINIYYCYYIFIN